MTTTSHAAPDRPNLPERIERVVRAWPQWSPAERRRMDEIVEDVLAYCRSGRGGAFIASFVERVVIPAAMAPDGRPRPARAVSKAYVKACTCPECHVYDYENGITDTGLADATCERCQISWRVTPQGKIVSHY